MNNYFKIYLFWAIGPKKQNRYQKSKKKKLNIMLNIVYNVGLFAY